MPACSPTIYEYYVQVGIPPYYVYYRWNKTTKTSSKLVKTTAPDASYFPLENGALVDVRETNIPGVGYRVQAVVIDYTMVSDNYLKYIDLISTSGDPSNRLSLVLIAGTSVSVEMYAIAAKEETILTLTAQGGGTAPVAGYPADGWVFTPGDFSNTPCINTQSYLWDITYCDGYTKHSTEYDGSSVVITNTVNSPYCGYTEPVTGGFELSERKRFKVSKDCPANPVYILWLNTLGGWEQWLFSRKQIYTADVTTDGSFQLNHNTIADISNPERVTKKQVQERMQLRCEGLTLNDKEALSQIKYSNRVCIANAELTSLIDVNVVSDSFLLKDTSAATSTLDLEIVIPKKITIGN